MDNSDSEDGDYIPQDEELLINSNKEDSNTKKENNILRKKKMLILEEPTKIQKIHESQLEKEQSTDPINHAKGLIEHDKEQSDDSNILAMFSKGIKAKKSHPVKKFVLPKSWLEEEKDNSSTNEENENISEDISKRNMDNKKDETMKVTKYKYANEEILIKEPDTSKSKPVSNLSALLKEMKGKNKLSSLQKSKYDWDQYTTEEKIEIELEQNKKNGYLQKLSFLQETDVKQFEHEREVRTKSRR